MIDFSKSVFFEKFSIEAIPFVEKEPKQIIGILEKRIFDENYITYK